MKYFSFQVSLDPGLTSQGKGAAIGMGNVHFASSAGCCRCQDHAGHFRMQAPAVAKSVPDGGGPGWIFY